MMDIDSKFYFSVTKFCQDKIKNSEFGHFSRRVIQQLCCLHQKELIKAFCTYSNDDDQLKKEFRNILFKIDKVYLLKNVSIFFVIWLYGFLRFFLSVIFKKKTLKGITLFEGPIESFSSLDVFQRMRVRMGGVFNTEDITIVSKTLNGSNKWTENCLQLRRLPYDLIPYCPISLTSLFKFILYQFQSLYLFIKIVFQFPLASCIFRDFLSWPYIKFIDDTKLLKAYVKTNSEYNLQQFWLEDKTKSYDYYTIWYSLNTKNFEYKDLSSFDHYHYHLNYIEKTLTWAPWHRSWLLQNSPNIEVRLTEPLSFGKGKPAIGIISKSVVIFDVLPKNKEMLAGMFVDSENFYYDNNTLISFLESIVESAKGTDYKLYLKSKRIPNKNVRVEYLEYINTLADMKMIELLDPETDVEDIISKTSFSISIPFTSTAYVASALGQTAVFYDSTGKLVFSGREQERVYFINDIKNLKSFFRAY